MAKKKEIPQQQGPQREAADYYKLKTQAVEDLVTANKENSPKVSEAELRKYRSYKGVKPSHWVKVVFLKWWFAGAVCFFIFWGLGTYVRDMLDMMLVFGFALGTVTDLLTNNILHYYEETEHANDCWMMFRPKKLVSLPLNILYGGVLLAIVYWLYQVINGVIIAITGQMGSVPFGVEPIGFGLLYAGTDLLLLGVRRLIKRIVSDARDRVSNH